MTLTHDEHDSIVSKILNSYFKGFLAFWISKLHQQTIFYPELGNPFPMHPRQVRRIPE